MKRNRPTDRALHLADQVFGDGETVSWRFVCPAAPVQAQGLVGGTLFCFRSRWNQWTFAVASGREPDPARIQAPDQGFFRTAVYRPHRYAASYMPLDVAKAIVERCLAEYLALHPGGRPGL